MDRAQLRRQLAFADFSQLLDDIDRCRPAHTTLGSWTLAQICRHLADTFNGSIDGFNMGRHRLKRWLLGRKLLKLTLKQGIPPGYTVDPGLNPPDGLELGSELGRLQSAIARYRAFRGTLKPHPLFGRLSRLEWDELHLFHAAHHLSFVCPVSGNRNGDYGGDSKGFPGNAT